MRFYQNSDFIINQDYVLDDGAAHHLVHVLRAKEGTIIYLFNGDGVDYAAKIMAINKKQVLVRVLKAIMVQRESPLKVHILQGICRSDKMDLILQKATELGMAEFTPIITSRVNMRLSSAQLAQKQAHWQRVVISACEQCGRAIIPKVNAPLKLMDDIAQASRESLKIVLDPKACQGIQQLSQAGTDVALLIGPEGGLSDEEIMLAKNHGFNATRLGPRILRTETVALSVLSILQAKWGDLA